jgi:putative peptidoglycan lipid II flippase
MKKLSFLSRITLLLGFFFTLDKLLGFLRVIIIARAFNLSFQLDAFNAADILPTLLTALMSGEALSMAFIPILTQTLTLRGRQAAWDLFSRVVNLAFIITGAMSLIAAVFADPIVRMWITPGFNASQQHIVSLLMRLDLIAAVIFSISGLVVGGLQANEHFLLPALAPILYNIGQIFGAAILAPAAPLHLGPITLPAFNLGVYGLAYGVILGAALHLLIQIPALARYGFRWTPSIKINDPAMIASLKVIGPRVLTVLLVQLMFVARSYLGSMLGQTGAITSLIYGWMIMEVPETLLGTAIATAMLPTLSEYAARADWSGFRQTIEKAIQVLIALSLPAGAIIAAGIHPILRAAFHFDEAGTDLLTFTTRIYMLTLCGYALQEVAARAFYARKEALIPLATAVIRLLTYLVIGISGLIFFKSIGAPAIALAELSLTVEAIVMLIILNHRMKEPVKIDGILLKGLVAALFGGGATYILALMLPGGALVTAILGMIVGTIIALMIVRREVRLFFKLGKDENTGSNKTVEYNNRHV